MRRLMVWMLLLALACTLPSAVADTVNTSVQDVTLRISAEQDTYIPGETAVFTLTVENGSDKALTEMVFSEVSIGSGTWTDTVKSLPAGASVTAVYAVRMPDALHDCALFDVRWSSGSITLQYRMTALTPVRLSITAEEDDWSWDSGKAHSADFTVTNDGDLPLENVMLTLGRAYTDDGADAGQATFLRKDRRKLKSAEQTAAYTIPLLEPGESVTMSAQLTPEIDLSMTEGLSLPMQATVLMDGRSQSVTAVCTQTREVITPGMWTAVIRGDVTMGHLLCALSGLTVLVALAACIRAKKLR
ncbi:MAG: hypothetical protein IKK21_01320 [Clostridia bacterium]|nr:hypothetical protein [Clostridia bacterium]